MDVGMLQKLIQLQALSNMNQLSGTNQKDENATTSLFSSLFNNELNSLGLSTSSNIIDIPQPTLSYGETVAQLLGKSTTSPVQLIEDEIAGTTSSSSIKKTNSNVDRIINEMANKYDVDPKLIRSIIKHESGFNPNAVSSVGAKGLMQIMPSNFESYGITNPFDPKQNIEAGTRMIKANLRKYNGNIELALAAYNAGSGNVKKYGGIPPFKETQNYVRKVTESYYA
ncbi:lytic transglycosylase domain-containing protein [Gottfriedia luciferensis]|uniref:lytic transglycosylase domain-containing protein n=1 Tax=Gottfriedia luciferensis TaxID=178774 RepID=UPI000B43AB4C|nr:lytic transglycosylase domain-containing protein [Gottfriedia luciferensis]